jgi:hypothetical protein
MKKPKRNARPMTLEDFAAVIQADLVRMATKDDVKELATKKDLERLATKEDLDNVRGRIANATEQIQEQIAGLRYAKEIDELRARVHVLEGKLGIKPARRAA